MARPGDQDYEWSDFDFSDIEDDLNEIEHEKAGSDSDSTSEHGSEESNANVVAAGGHGKYVCGECGREYKTAGWLSRHKAKEHEKTTDESQPGTASTSDGQGRPEPTSSKGPGSASKPRRKIQVKRPASQFREEDAEKEGQELVKDALEAAIKHPSYTLKVGSWVTPGNTAANTAAALLHIWGTFDPTQFIKALCSELLSVIIAGEKSVLSSAANEAMFAAYHKFCISERYHTLWKTLMSSVGIKPCFLLHQFVTKKVLEGLLRKKHSTDVPISVDTDTNVEMTKAEEQVLRYIAGYIPHALLRRYQKQSNKIAKLYVHVLQQWKVSSVNSTHETFLQYTQGWIEAVNRGGLFVVTDEVYLFFRTVEKVVRATANFQQFRHGKLTSMKDTIIHNLESDVKVNKYWCNLASNSITNEKASIALLETVLTYYVHLRCRAFANAYNLVTRQKNNDSVSKKGEKSLRKSLSKK